MLRPLIFRNSFRNIQKIKNGLRIKCCAPHQSVSRTASPRGEAYEIGRNFKFMRFATVRYGTPEGCAAGVLDKARDSHHSPNACDTIVFWLPLITALRAELPPEGKP